MKRFSFARLASIALLAASVTIAVTPPASASVTTIQPSIAQLSVAQSKLNQAASSRPGSVTGWYVDAATRSLVVSVFGSEQGVAQWAARQGAGSVTIEHVSEAPRPLWELIGGQPIYFPGGIRCTLGFNARRSDSTRYVITAGHCTNLGGTVTGVGGVIGPVAGSSFPGNDYGIVRVTSTDAVSTPYVGTDRFRVTVSGAATASVGMAVCTPSQTTGWRCGSVVGVNQTVCYAQGCVYGLIKTNFCSEPGSSGAPVVTNPSTSTRVQAIGVISGGSGNCSTGGTTYVQPIGEVLSVYGLTLYAG